MFELVRSLNGSLEGDGVSSPILEKAFDRTWPELEERLVEATKIRIGSENVRHVVSAFAKFGLPEPSLGSAAFFREGYESHAIYETAMAVAQSRLYVFGRKNRKVFDKDHAAFFRALPARVREGFDVVGPWAGSRR